MEPLIQMNKFEIVDMPGMTTIAFLVEENEIEYKQGKSLLSLQKIDSIDSQEEGKMKKTFNVIKTDDEPQLIVLLTLTNTKAILSTGELTAEGFKTTESNIPLNYGTLFNQVGVEYKEVEYTPNMKRHFSIIDTQTGEEVKPVLYTDEVTGKVKGRCKILPNRPYIVLELGFED
ncbi:MAG: hypothetical protein PHP54_00520 [Clostridia bacterium]|nr:hypothetical protein [Clostridia bacterium]